MKTTKSLLKNSLRCDIHIERDFLSYYSVDASSYQIKPNCIVFPRTIKDIKTLIKIARKENLSITPRGAGTGLVGNSLNRGIIVDMKNFNKINVEDNCVIVGPGVLKGSLDRYLGKIDKFFSPNPSIGPFCQIGGMIGTNASGSKALKYGSIIDNLKEVTFVDGKGNLVSLPNDKKYSQNILKIVRKIDAKRFPNVSKNSCGYRLDKLENTYDSPKVLAGSEGTLGIIVSAKLKIYDIPPKKVLIVMGYQSVKSAAMDCEKIIKTKPSSLEFVDKKTILNMDYTFAAKFACLLFIEYDADLGKSEKSLKKITSGKIVKRLTKESEIQKWWRFRDSALWYSLRSIKLEKRIPHVIEDAVVPLKSLPKLFFTIKRLNQIYDTDSVFYGHAGNGNIHVRLISDRHNLNTLKEIAQKYFQQIIRMGGSITGEHGDGLARSEFIEEQYGKKNYQVFKRLKRHFDPDNILNPEKIISSRSTIIKNFEKFNPKSF